MTREGFSRAVVVLPSIAPRAALQDLFKNFLQPSLLVEPRYKGAHDLQCHSSSARRGGERCWTHPQTRALPSRLYPRPPASGPKPWPCTTSCASPSSLASTGALMRGTRTIRWPAASHIPFPRAGYLPALFLAAGWELNAFRRHPERHPQGRHIPASTYWMIPTRLSHATWR